MYPVTPQLIFWGAIAPNNFERVGILLDRNNIFVFNYHNNL